MQRWIKDQIESNTLYSESCCPASCDVFRGSDSQLMRTTTDTALKKCVEQKVACVNPSHEAYWLLLSATTKT